MPDTGNAVRRIAAYLDHLLLNKDVQVGVIAALQLRVQIPVGRVAAPSIGTDVLLISFETLNATIVSKFSTG